MAAAAKGGGSRPRAPSQVARVWAGEPKSAIRGGRGRRECSTEEGRRRKGLQGQLGFGLWVRPLLHLWDNLLEEKEERGLVLKAPLSSPSKAYINLGNFKSKILAEMLCTVCSFSPWFQLIAVLRRLKEEQGGEIKGSLRNKDNEKGRIRGIKEMLFYLSAKSQSHY